MLVPPSFEYELRQGQGALRPSAAEMYGFAKDLTQLSTQASDLQTSEHRMEIIRIAKTQRRRIWQRLVGSATCDKVANQISVKKSNQPSQGHWEGVCWLHLI
jgi:hypothetical protein